MSSSSISGWSTNNTTLSCGDVLITTAFIQNAEREMPRLGTDEWECSKRPLAKTSRMSMVAEVSSRIHNFSPSGAEIPSPVKWMGSTGCTAVLALRVDDQSTNGSKTQRFTVAHTHVKRTRFVSDQADAAFLRSISICW